MNATSAAIPGHGELFINRAKGYGERNAASDRGIVPDPRTEDDDVVTDESEY